MAGLSQEQMRIFREEGVLVVESVFRESHLGPVIEEYADWVDQKANALAANGKISNLYKEAPFERRIALLYAQCPTITEGLDIMYVRGPATFAFLHNERLLDIAETLLGPDITCNPIQHIRPKLPASLTGEGTGFYNVPWHQDAAVTWEEADSSNILTFWIPLVDATVENGCMEVMPGAWKMGYLPHQAEGGTTIRPECLPNVPPRPIPVRKGGMVIMHRHTPHRSTPNYTDQVRWSLDLRYQPTGEPTGRPFHPDFVVRSRKSPQSVLNNYAVWCKRWEEALANSRGMKAHRV